MFKSSTSLAAVAGIAAGVASTAVAPAAPAAAQPAEPAARVQQDESGIASHGTCFDWTRFAYRTGDPRSVYIPTTARNNRQAHCILRQGNNTTGGFKLEDALRRCYHPRFWAGMAVDNHYDQATAAAVKRVQDFHRIPVDGVYGPQTRASMEWPIWRGDSFLGCDRFH